MTLTEYLNQENPVRMPKVLLDPSEYFVGNFFGAYGARVADVSIKGIEFSYVLKEGNPNVYTTDSQGNPDRPSCFWINLSQI